ncbi:GTP-binding protein [Formosa sediminum]|uniref:GTP-binding protein n=1 Tax=Formosa sediminum TaxID=2594004 RepID=A0A516GMP6_9FLAO|nr:GTP-binding protein [Formosa sediminum]QDO92745.1 GTP-binding protein [Formosa sediminum]
MNLDNEIVLRPRFKLNIPRAHQTVLAIFEALKDTQTHYIVSCVDDHVFIRIPKPKQHFWSPQLHLEVNALEKDTCSIHGLFGPNPTVWTLFMFLHFIVAMLFIGFGIWGYSNWVLDQSYSIQLTVCISMIALWFIFYFIGRAGRAKGKNDMLLLHRFMTTSLNL